MPSSVEAARQQWEDGNRRLEAYSSDPDVYEPLLDQLGVATEELRKRVGETFTLTQLAEAYAASDNWMREALEDRVASPRWERRLSVVQDAAFHLYARGATDYVPRRFAPLPYRPGEEAAAARSFSSCSALRPPLSSSPLGSPWVRRWKTGPSPASP